MARRNSRFVNQKVIIGSTVTDAQGNVRALEVTTFTTGTDTISFS